VIEVPAGAGQAEVQELASEREKIRQHLAGKSVEKVFYVPGKILSIVTKK
jgi:leucyl-tRNA synthetase